MSKKKQRTKRKSEDQFEREILGVKGLAIDYFLEDVDPEMLNHSIDCRHDYVFNNEDPDVIREFAVFLIVQLRGLIFDPEKQDRARSTTGTSTREATHG